MSIKAISEDLDLLVQGLHDLRRQDPDEETAARRQLKRLYRQLHSRLSSVGEPELKSLSDDQRLLVSYMEMGKEPFDRFHAKILPLIGPSADKTAVAIAKFNNSSEAFSLVNDKQDKLSDKERAHVRDLLGGVLGVAVGDDFVQSVRGEMMGRVIAYALSGLCERDLADYALLDKQKASTPGRDRFLLERIVARDAELVYSIKAPDRGSNVWSLACAIDEGAGVEAGTTRKKQRADTCIVNHDKKKIVFGSVTSNTSANKKQALPLSKMVAALQLLCEQEYVGGDPSRPNPYYGYTVEPFYLHTGTMDVEQVVEKKAGTGAALFKMLISEDVSISKDEHRAIAKMAFFSLLGEGDPNPATARVLQALNVHICGCDTLDLYNEMVKARCAPAKERAFPKLCLASINEALNVLSRDDTTVSTTGRGQNLLRPAIESIIKAADYYFVNFPVKGSGKVDSVEFQMLKQISANMGALAGKLAADGSGSGNDLIKALRAQSRKWASRQTVAEDVAEGAGLVEMKFAWDQAQHGQLASKMDLGLDGKKARDAVIDSIISDLSRRQMPQILSQAIDLGLTADGKLANREWVRDMFAQVQKTAQGGHAATNIKGGAEAGSLSRTPGTGSFNQTFCNVLSGSDEGHPGARVARAMRPLFRDGIWASRPGMAKNQAAREAVADMVDHLLQMDPSQPGVVDFFASLSQLAHPAQSAPVRGGSRMR